MSGSELPVGPEDGDRIPCQFPCDRDVCTGTLEFDEDANVWFHVEPGQSQDTDGDQ